MKAKILNPGLEIFSVLIVEETSLALRSMMHNEQSYTSLVAY